MAAKLEDIIVFLKNTFGRYFNTDLDLPIPLKLREGHEVKHQWKMIAKTIAGAEANIPMMNMLDQCMKGLLPINEE